MSKMINGPDTGDNAQGMALQAAEGAVKVPDATDDAFAARILTEQSA
jgi:hypothetical protein